MENGNGHGLLPTSDFFSEVPAPCGLLGLDGTVRAINPAFSEMFGWAAEDLLDTSYIDRLHVDDRDRTQSLFQECLSQGRARLLACRVMHKLGSYRLLYWGIKPSFEEGVVYAGGQDVTDLGAFPLVGPLNGEAVLSEAGSGKSNPTKRELEVLGLAAQGLSTRGGGGHADAEPDHGQDAPSAHVRQARRDQPRRGRRQGAPPRPDLSPARPR